MTPLLHEEKGLLYGLGAANAKVDLLLKLLVASRIEKKDLKRPIYVIGLSGDESQGLGLEGLLDGRFPTPGAALISAPTNLELWTRHPGSVTIRLSAGRPLRHRRMPSFRGMVEIDIEGRSAHAQSPGVGRDALARGLAVLKSLRAHGELRVLSISGGEGAHRLAGQCRMQLATSFEELPPLPAYARVRHLSDGVAVPLPIDKMLGTWLRAYKAGINAVKQELDLSSYARESRPIAPSHMGWIKSDRDALRGELTLWTGPGVEQRALLEKFAEAAHAKVSDSDESRIDIEVVQERRPFEQSDIDGDFVGTFMGAMKGVGIPPVLSEAPYTSDAGRLRGEGVSTLLFGPGRGLAHLYRDDECLPIKHLESVYRTYDAFIKRWCT